MANEYPIETLAQMAEIPAEARARFLSEMPSILATMVQMQLMAEEMAEMGLGEMITQTPRWVDDDKGEQTIIVSVDGESQIEIKSKMQP